ncbi:MAG TPA: hypothetical protein VLT33_08450 [Labilithrix sp.]|nr:hypothetical protein [Labilithrix sp.]
MAVAYATVTMSPASSRPAGLDPRAVIAARPARRTVSLQAASAIVGATVLGSAAAIEVARAWTTAPGVLAEAGHAIGGVVVALFLVSGLGLAGRWRSLNGLAVASTFVLVAHGATLVLQGQLIGALFVGLAPLVAAVAHVAFIEPEIAPVAPSSDRIDIAWAIAKSRQKTARAARRAVSRNHFVMPV